MIRYSGDVVRDLDAVRPTGRIKAFDQDQLRSFLVTARIVVKMIAHRMRTVLKAAGLPPPLYAAQPASLLASILVSKGTPIADVQQALGHVDRDDHGYLEELAHGGGAGRRQCAVGGVRSGANKLGL